MNVVAALLKLPLCQQVKEYQAAWLTRDIAAGLSVAAVSLPSAIAYPAIAQLPIETGLFAAIFAMVGYAALGPSRQLMVGPDTATCITLAGVIGTLGMTAPSDRAGMAQTLAILVGLLYVAARLLRLGVIANFLSRPMLVGFLTGISISLIIGQFTRLTGVPIESDGLLRPIMELGSKVQFIHPQTLMVGVGVFLVIRLVQRLLPGKPAPLIAIVIAILASAALDLQQYGVETLGQLPPIEFAATWPDFRHIERLPDLLSGALAIMLVSFGSGIVTARSFAMKARNDVNADRELLGFGGANICSGLFGGFPVTASDSRTAVNFVIGGRTQLTALIAAAGVAVTIIFIGDILSLLPKAALGAILVSAAIDLIDIDELRAIRRIDPVEFGFALVTILGVVLVGVLQGVFLAMAVTLAQLIWTASHPKIALLGRLPGHPELVKLHRYPAAQPISGMIIVRVQSAVVFFNADYLKQRLLKLAMARRDSTSWVIVDASAINLLDSTAIAKFEELRAALADAGLTLCLSELNSRARQAVRRSGLADRLAPGNLFNTTEAAIDAVQEMSRAASLKK
jgi:high affinity sulfate transporter 1